MRFEFATATRILFGEGMMREAAPAAAAMGRRALLVTGVSRERAAPLAALLESSGVACASFTVPGEPTVELVRAGTAYARGEQCSLVVALGGGSAIDAGKALAAMLANPGDPLDYLEVIGAGRPIKRPSVPFIAIPTTAGTGSEVTRNAVLASPGHRVKASLRGAGMLPRLAVVDPELTLDLPRSITASTGLDALTQCIEPYVSARANPMTDLVCVEGIRRAAAALPRVWENGRDRQARVEMAWVSLLGGMALANAALGDVHGFAAPIGGEPLRRYEEVARLLTGRPHATAEDGVRWVATLCRKLEVPPLHAYGVADAEIPDLVGKAAHASSMKGNPIVLTPDELRQIVSASL
jgi:alcohol dehydrogenase class IV